MTRDKMLAAIKEKDFLQYLPLIKSGSNTKKKKTKQKIPIRSPTLPHNKNLYNAIDLQRDHPKETPKSASMIV